MDNYTILCTELRGSAQSLKGNIDTLQKKADKLQKAINKVTRGDYKASDISSAYTAQTALAGSITRLGEICGAMDTAALQFLEASAELGGRANLTAYYMQHTDTLSYEGLMGTYTAAIASAGSAAAGYELVQDTLNDNGYSADKPVKTPIAAPLASLLALATALGSGGGGSRGENADSVSNDDANNVKFGDNPSVSDVGTQLWEDAVDEYRKNTGCSGKKAEHENILYSSTKTGTISILDTEIRYEKYTDYIEGSVETVEGDNFYSVDAKIGKDGHHINFEATDGSGFSGEISAISAYAYGDGEVDLAKGNAYVKAGGGVSILKAEVGSESEWGGAFLEVGIGAEASADIGIHNGTFTFDITVPVYFGVTAGVDFEINYVTLWNDFCDTFGF